MLPPTINLTSDFYDEDTHVATFAYEGNNQVRVRECACALARTSARIFVPVCIYACSRIVSLLIIRTVQSRQ